jgi:outer membrane protein
MNQYCTVLLTVFLLVLFAGCGFPKHYSPSDIRAEYAAGSHSGISGVSHDSGIMKKAVSPPATRYSAPFPVDPPGEINVPLTLSRVIDITIENNPDLQQALVRIEQASAMKDLSDAAFWPAVGFYTEYMQGDAPSAYLFKKIDQRQLPQNTNFNDPGSFENVETGIIARMNIFNGGKDYLASRIAAQDVDISSLERQAVVNDLKAQVISAFYDVQASRKFIDIAKMSVASVSEQLRIMQVRYQGGGALKSDVLTLNVGLARAKEYLVETQKKYELAKTVLAHLMGFDPADISEDLEIENRAPVVLRNIPSTYEQGIVYAFAHRPELAKVRKQLVKSRLGLATSKAGYLPRIDLMGKYYVDDPYMEYHRDRENWTAAVMFNWELFTGFSTRARIKKAHAVVEEMLAVDRKTALNIRRDVKNAYLNLEAAQARYDVAKSSVESADEAYRLVTQYYKGGAVTITRYLDAELDRNRSRIRSTAALYDKIKANAEFARAIGMLKVGNPAAAANQTRKRQ